jgi:hypothetical protein
MINVTVEGRSRWREERKPSFIAYTHSPVCKEPWIVVPV